MKYTNPEQAITSTAEIVKMRVNSPDLANALVLKCGINTSVRCKIEERKGESCYADECGEDSVSCLDVEL